MSRTKGAAGEREALLVLGEELGIALTRNLQQTREGGADCLLVKGFALEIKRCEAMRRPSWWAQAQEQASRVGAEPMVLYRRSRKPWMALIQSADGFREATLAEAAGRIRERWMESA